LSRYVCVFRRREKPNDIEWRELDVQRRPLLLNFVQCQLKLGQFYSAIEHATTIIDSDSMNVKARYRRAKAHVGAWNVSEAKNDYNYLLSSIKDDENLRTLVQHELQQLIQAEQEKYQEDKSRLSGKLFL
jgi:AH receptor-interacting protein